MSNVRQAANGKIEWLFSGQKVESEQQTEFGLKRWG